ncbi:MAG TPA: hypothetical protein DEB06_04740 [Phycisphaerales bacterium]|nr:hypothetical protein [Phycisphaerales bacterium]
MAQDTPSISSSLRPIDADRFGLDEARHLLWRAGFGGTPQQVKALAAWGPEKAVEALVDFDKSASYPAPRPDEFDATLVTELSDEERLAVRRAAQSQDEDTLARFRQRRMEQERRDRAQIVEVQKWWLRRLIESPRPLQEKMTLFWHGHFATSYRTIENSYHMFLQNQSFRAHALGNFGELLFAIIRDPAMIAYLDNNDSRRQAPNENLARELMELFSLGEGNYGEKDIKEGARALTGYSFRGNQFAFFPDRHDDGPKVILGQSGNLDGDGFVRAILAQKACSEFLAAKLYQFFVAPIPARAEPGHREAVTVVTQMGSALRASRYELRPVLRRLFLSEHFYDPAVRLARIKSPAELVVGAARSLLAPTRELSVLLDAMDLMGQSLFFPPSVKGWDGGRRWINTSTLFVRQNTLNYMLTGRTPQGFEPLADSRVFDPAPLLAPLSPDDRKDPARLAGFLMRELLGAAATEDQRAALAHFLTSGPSPDHPDTLRGAIALITALPQYQLC